MSRTRLVVVSTLVMVAFVGCARRQAMYDQAKYKPFKPSEFFADKRSMRTPPAGTVAQGHLHEDELLNEGKDKGQVANVFPFKVTKEVLKRGQSRYNIYCTPCHAKQGNGMGMIVQRGFYKPPSFHEERLLKAPTGHFFNVITLGIGNMSSYAVQLTPEDRWSVIAYIRALQLSQNAMINDVPKEDRELLSGDSK